MNIEESNETDAVTNSGRVAWSQHVLFAKSAPGTTFGVVSDSEPSSLALLAAGVAGMAARRARRRERMKSLQSPKPEV
jgi:hypothetical protein